MTTDLQIAASVTAQPITEVAARIGIPSSALHTYGTYKAKVDLDYIQSLPARGKIVLVTAISPTPAGEGKTTTSIGLADGLALEGESVALALREPSMGPVFGMKGGATGGGHAQIVPMTDINLHFTGDFAAITAANNLLAALIDNHIHHGNVLGIDPRRVTWRRALDVNDRSLRSIVSGLGGISAGVPREAGFDITAASEIMAIFCLAKDSADLRARLGRIVVGRTYCGEEVTAQQLDGAGAMAAILHDALAPNLVQTLAGTPAFVHGGPFANIAHGCNSVIATRAACATADIVITEAGFGADLGAEKFLDLKCRASKMRPDLCVVVATIRALKYHGGVERGELSLPNVEAVRAGMANLEHHVKVLQEVFGQKVIVVINAFSADTDGEFEVVHTQLAKRQVPVVTSHHWAEGGEGALAAARVVKAMLAEAQPAQPAQLRFAYPDSLELVAKAEAVATQIYGAEKVVFTPPASKHIALLTAAGYGQLPVCIAKTQYSLSTDAKLRGAPRGHTLTIREVRLAAGAGFVVLVAGDIMTMPGLPKHPAAADIDLVDGTITGIF